VIALVVAAALVLGAAGGWALARQRRRAAAGDGVHRILLPFTGTEISRRALDAALRLARAEGGTLMPAYLVTVPLQLPLTCPLPKEAAAAMAMLEAIEQRAAAQEVGIDARIERGRTYRHALERLLTDEKFDRVVVPAQADGGEGLTGDDLVWLLRRAPAEVLILRPAPEDHRTIAAKNGHSPSTLPPQSPNAGRDEMHIQVP
jgi:nucleotide-binding universal stress UspA family protein